MFLLLPSVLLALVGRAPASSAPSDRCLMLDSCFFKTDAKSCSCQPDCHLYGTCCLGADQGAPQSAPAFQCYARKTREPLFALRSCKPRYRGHPHEGVACVGGDEDEADVVGRMPVTNRMTKVTYWNKQCAKCNDEDPGVLDFWDIVVQCEAFKGVDERFIRKHLDYDPDTLRWGLEIPGNFLPCLVLYSPPSSLDQVKYCTPDVIRTCPPEYPDHERVRKCSQAYAERKLKNADVYFRNVHCAICNGVDEKNVECAGMSAGLAYGDDADFRDVTEVVFSRDQWPPKRPGWTFQCSPGNAFDPFRRRCRTAETEDTRDVVVNSAAVGGRTSRTVLPILTLVLLLLK